MFETLRNAFKVGEIKDKLIFTGLMILVYRVGSAIPVPGIDKAALASLFQSDFFGFLNIMSGGSFKNFTVFALGIMPYINASIILNLLTVVIPYLENLSKEGPEGRKKLVQLTRYGTVVLGTLQGIGMTIYLKPALKSTSIWSYIVVVVTLTAGTAFLMWLGEMITERGIGNGISIIIFAGIVSRLPSGMVSTVKYLQSGELSWVSMVGFLVVAAVVIVGVIAIHEGERRIPVQYAKRVIGRKIYGGQSTHIPLKVNQAGVIPIIFAMSILMFPTTIASWFPNSGFAQGVSRIFDFTSIWYMMAYGLLILFFTYFYTAMTFNPVDVAENLKKHGGFIPGYRPGKYTAEHIEKVVSRVTFSGAVFLALIALMPNILWATTGVNFQFGGTSLLIMVGVALDTMKQLESQLLMRHYKGFMG